MTSPDAVAPNGAPDQDVVQVLIDTTARGNPVDLVSNGEGPRMATEWVRGIAPCVILSSGRTYRQQLAIDPPSFIRRSNGIPSHRQHALHHETVIAGTEVPLKARPVERYQL